MSKAEVYIIESLGINDENDKKEGEILSKTLYLSGKRPIYRYVRTRKELRYFVDDFQRSDYRYLHFSSHGDTNLIALTLDDLTNKEFACIMGEALGGRRLFLSTCLATTENLAEEIFSQGRCLSIAGPVSEIPFDDAAIMWSSFYHLMFKTDSKRMVHRDIVANLMICGWMLARPIRYFKRSNTDTPKEMILPPLSIIDRRLDGIIDQRIMQRAKV